MNEPKPLPTACEIEAKYKVCEGCDRVLTLEFDQCPVCHAHRFDHSIDRINAVMETWHRLRDDRVAKPRAMEFMAWEDFNCPMRGR
jgi:hypothetical protein